MPVGTIISQNPAPGTEVPKGSDVQVVVSTAPQLVTLPNVTCLSYGAAKAQLQGLGLVVVPGGTAPMLPECPNPSRVAAMSPAADTQVEVGSTVTLFIGEVASPSPESPSP